MKLTCWYFVPMRILWFKIEHIQLNLKLFIKLTTKLKTDVLWLLKLDAFPLKKNNPHPVLGVTSSRSILTVSGSPNLQRLAR